MIAVLQDSSDSIVAVLAAAVATTEPVYSVVWTGDGGPANPVGSFTGATSKTLLAGVTPRQVESIEVYNRDTAAVSVTISKTTGGTTYPLVNVSIPVGGTLHWSQARGVEVLSTSGTTPSDSVGAIVAGIGVTAVESGFGNFRRTILTLTATPLSLTDALAYVGLKLYDFQAGRYRFLDCVASLTFTTTSVIASTLNSGVTVSWGLGTVTASSITLATTMMNLLPGSGESVKSFTSSTVINTAPATVTGFLANIAAAQLAACIDGTTTSPDLFLNIGVPTITDIDADATLTVSGTITLTYVNGGDF